MAGSVITWPLDELLRRLADPGDPSGSGLLAAVTLAGASAVARMVASLEMKRVQQDQSRVRVLIEASQSFERLTTTFLQQADHDRVALARLLAALRARRRSTGHQPVDSLQDAAMEATRVPLATGDFGLELLRSLSVIAPLCSPFVASDLLAAGDLARAGIAAAIRMVLTNLPLVENSAASDLRVRAHAITEEAQALLIQLSAVLPSTETDEDEANASSLA